MRILQEILYRGLEVYVLIIIGQILLSFFPTQPGSPLYRVNIYLRRATDPVYLPLRRIIPPVAFGSAALDLSPLIILLVIQILMRIVNPGP
ncbi:YggT family protein [Acidithrix ferrooxidans]|uniref:YGGT family protein n=1 Tax=Acidithrix ferrooxidans TaxID=1280514 RepID=A0A0D8HM31_9ACTN|nr:YggT family protein [Acidithrix ferrooxidans]KJF19060.1 YGGT family protein [Acidithrix ferrooxidans]